MTFEIEKTLAVSDVETMPNSRVPRSRTIIHHNKTLTNEYSLMHQDQIEAIISGKCRDVFSLLGIHPTPDPAIKRVSVFLPGAEKVSVMSESGKTKLATLAKLHDEGIFSGNIVRRSFAPYTLEVQYPLATLLVEDVYSFPPQITDYDLYLFNHGEHEEAYTFLGANARQVHGVDGYLFAVWAPSASRIAVVGDFNSWDSRMHVMRKHHECGVWEIFIPQDLAGAHYKFLLHDAGGKPLPLKADPYAKQMQLRPETASSVRPAQAFDWCDSDWMKTRQQKQNFQSPISIYEVHLGSWRRNADDQTFLSYDDLANQLIPYVKDLGFTHIQLMPISEHPFDGSWGYQPIGMYAPTSRFGSADDFRRFIDAAHRADIGVLLDWVPGHFPTDEHGLGRFDGTHIYEHADPRLGFHPDWNTLIYNYDQPEVISYLLSNAVYWLAEFHLDGLRFDAVASMLYLDYSRKEDEWIPNRYGGRENLGAIKLLQLINTRVYRRFPDIMMVAEESTAWPGVTRRTDMGGLGFGFKWNLGWMNDTLRYLSRETVHRQYHANEITFGLLYAFDENFILPLSHDEVVHGKGSLLEKMPGDEWQKFATLRAYLGFMWCHPGKKLSFMGNEFAQRREWNHDQSLDWHLLDHERHAGIQFLVRDLNALYINQSALFRQDTVAHSFEWVEANHPTGGVFAFVRRDTVKQSLVVVITNFTPVVFNDFRLGVPEAGLYEEMINSDSQYYGGTNQGSVGGVESQAVQSHGKSDSINIVVPPLATVVFQRKV